MHVVAVGGSDAGISAGLRARELQPHSDVTVIVADAFPNYSICGIPYYVSGDVRSSADLAHRTGEDLAAAGLDVRTDTCATRIAVADRRLTVRGPNGREEQLPYDALVVGTGATSVLPPIEGVRGPDGLGPKDGVHLLHSMGDAFALLTTIESTRPRSAVVVGGGYIGLEMAEALSMRGALVVYDEMRTGLPHVYAAGDCVVTHHRLLGTTWVPLGTTAHKQGRVAGENAVGGARRYAGSLGTQVVKVFDAVAARTGLRDHEACAARRGWAPATTASAPEDHKAYYPGATPLDIRVTGDARTGRLLGAQLVGRRSAEVSKRVDVYATALFHEMLVADVGDLDLSYSPPLGSPWDAVQMATHDWALEHVPAGSPGE